MARGRMVNRELVNSGEFHDLPYWAQVLWGLGMIPNASDEGLIRACPAWLRHRFLMKQPPLKVPSVARVGSLLRRWESRRMLEQVEKDGVSYYRITNFHKYQTIKGPGKEGKGKEKKGREGETPQIGPGKESKKWLQSLGYDTAAMTWDEIEEARKAELEKARKADRERRKEEERRSRNGGCDEAMPPEEFQQRVKEARKP